MPRFSRPRRCSAGTATASKVICAVGTVLSAILCSGACGCTPGKSASTRRQEIPAMPAAPVRQ